jgi:imidazoleglycerol-phosphate dehydratase/histidinol-phosphatase
MSYQKYLFLDRDGTLIEEPLDNQVDSFEKFRLLPHVIPSLISLQSAGYFFVMVSNQDGLGSANYPESKFEMIQKLLLDILQSQGIRFESIRICPHFEKDKCFCRKPQVGLLRDFMSSPTLDRTKSFVIGDRTTDLVLAENMGIPGIQIRSGYGWEQVTDQLLILPRLGSCTRKTKETQISVQVTLDSAAPNQISTGVGFLDHMIEQLSYHGSFSTTLKAAGDFHIDDHHTIEDIAITLGTALRQALGDKVGIERFGFLLPMDDSVVQVALDLSGRSFFRFEGKFARESIGGIATEMVPHFFRSFSESLAATLHIKMEGENTHHQVESIFKAVGRSLRSAIQLSRTGQTPSTKGVL